MRTLLLSISVLALHAAGAADAQQLTRQKSLGSVPTPQLLDTAGMFIARFAKVGDDVFVAGQPTAKALRELKAMGVTTVVNLRTPPEITPDLIGYDERKLIEELGMKYVHIPVRGSAEFPYSPEALARFSEVMKSAEGKVLLHCTIAWRASHLWAAYLIQQGVPVAEALRHARAINLMDEHRMVEGKQPIELFLDRAVAGLGKP